MTALLITGLIIGLGAGLALGAVFWGRYSDTVDAQAEEIEALQSDNIRLRGQAAELATLAHEAQAQAETACRAEFVAMDIRHSALAMLEAEIEAHRATKRTLATTRAWVTRLRRNYE